MPRRTFFGSVRGSLAPSGNLNLILKPNVVTLPLPIRSIR
jgi:hypothetical protein